jgi:hypothetical protein
MPGDLVHIASMPGLADAQLLREVLNEGGVTQVDIRASVGVAYLGRSSNVEYDVRVPDVDEARARALLAHYQEEASRAAEAQASTSVALPLGIDDKVAALLASDEMGERLLRKQRMVVTFAFVVAAVLIAPLVFSALLVLMSFIRGR